MRNGFSDVVFVTGGAGFIGSNYLNTYVPRCPERLFVNIDCLTYAGNVENVTVDKEKNYILETVDIRDVEKLTSLFETYAPTGVIHFAAESHVDVSIENPDVFIGTNIVGTHNLLKLAREYRVKRFHQISTDEVYGALSAEDSAFTEDAPLTPRNPYSASKAAADLLVGAYHETFGLNTVITRSSNNYGPNQDLSKVIPSFITKLLRGEKVPLYGEGAQMREWVYVGDSVDAIHLVFEQGVNGGMYNIGSQHEMSNLQLTKALLSLTGRDMSSISYVTDRLGHDFRYSLDSSKLRNELGWVPKVSFDVGLRNTFEHYKRIHSA